MNWEGNNTKNVKAKTNLFPRKDRKHFLKTEIKRYNILKSRQLNKFKINKIVNSLSEEV